MHLLWAITRKKKKKLKSKLRSRPRPLPLPRPSSLIVPDSIRFVYLQRNHASSYEWYVVRIPSKQLQFFDQVEPNSYTPHDHHHHRCDPTRFRSMDPDKYLSFLAHNPRWIGASSPAVIGSHVYSLLGETEESEFWSFCLDNKTPPRSLPPPLRSTRRSRTVLSVRGKVYIWGGLDRYSKLREEAFGEVYDPETEQWSYVPQPPDAEILMRAVLFSLLIVSLGELEGKVMIYNSDRLNNPKFYFYDVVSKKWTVRVPPRSLQINPNLIRNRPIINEDDGNLYWIDRQLCFIHVFDWKAMQLFSGPIVGIEHEDAFIYIKKTFSSFSLHHLWGDFFCLNWENHVHCSENHFTFLRIVKGPSPGSMSAFVIGCFMDSSYGRSFIEGVIRF